MPPAIATIIFTIGVIGLFFLDRDKDAHTSPGLWVATVWMWISCSRAVTQWLATVGLLGGAWAGQTASPDQYLAGSPIDAASYTVLLAAGLFVLIVRRNRTLQFLKANGPIIFFYLYCASAILWSDYPGVAAKRWIKFIGNLVIALVILTDIDPHAAIKRLMTRLSFTLVPLSILFIKYYPDFGRSLDPRPGQWVLVYTGVTANKNEMGMVCMILGLSSVWLLLHRYNGAIGWERRRHQIAHIATLLMIFWLFWEINSATSLSCFMMGCIVIIAASNFRLFRQPAVMGTLTITMLSVSIFALFADSGGNLVGALGRNSTLTGRTGLWDILMKMRGNLFFGTGFESFWLGQRIATLWSMIWWHPTESHDGYLETFLNIGLVGVAMLAMLIITGFRNALVSFKQDSENNSIKLALVVAALAYNLTEAAFMGTNPIFLLLLMATIAVPAATLAEAPSLLPVAEVKDPVLLTGRRSYQLPGGDRTISPVTSGVSRRINRHPA